METILKRSCLPILAVLVFAFCSMSAFAEEQGKQENDSLVGRIAHIEGQLLRYVPDEDDWVLTDVDTPFGEYDNLFSSEDGKVEIIMPNNTLLRIGGDTQVQLIELTNEVTEVDVSSGTVRLYNKSSSAEIKAITPFGDVIMPPETVCDISVHDEQVEVATLKGTVGFTRAGSKTRHELIAGSSSIIATSEQIVASAHSVNEAWDNWNVDRDVQWTQRMQARGDSQKYLPESLQDNAVDLDSNGRWERVYYEGADRYFWRPVYVSAGWTPFSAGRWIVWHGEQTWVPCEPFGYVTHHYGNWVYARNCWYWAPPVSAVMVSTGAPFLSIGMSWYPGRVAWVSSSISIGWFPLAPYEMYYSSRYWGPGCRVRYYNNYYDCRTYKHYKHARYIDHHRYYGSRNYRHAGLRKGHNNEKFRGSARFPEKMRRNFKPENQHQYASNMPKFRDRVKKIDVRGVKQGRLAAGNRAGTNPFKRNVAKGFENNRRAGTTIGENTSKKVLGKNKQVQPRLASAHKNVPNVRQKNNERTNRLAQANTQNRKELVARAKRAFEQPSIKMAGNRTVNPVKARPSVAKTSGKITGNRKTLQASLQGSRQKTSRKFDTAGQGRSNSTLNAKSTGSAMGLQSNRSGTASRESFSNTNSRIATSYTRSAGRQRVQQNSTARMQSYGARGRW